MFKKEKGITLVALVVTIIVLLILAGVSISMVVGENGIATKAKEAGTKTDVANAQDAMNIAVHTAVTEAYADFAEDTSTALDLTLTYADISEHLQGYTLCDSSNASLENDTTKIESETTQYLMEDGATSAAYQVVFKVSENKTVTSAVVTAK